MVEKRAPEIPPFTPQTVSTKQFHPKMWRGMVMCELIRRYGWTRGVELGVFKGRLHSALLKHNKGLRMIGVDLWEPQPEHTGPENWVYDHSGVFEMAKRMTHTSRDRTKLIKGKTCDSAVLDQVPDGSQDFIFIDADHSYEGCRNDILHWSAKLKPEGWLIGHDIQWPTVLQAVEELVPGYEVFPEVIWARPLNPQPGWADELKDFALT